MDTLSLKGKIPTFIGYIEKHREARRNQLPKHLRPLPKWPIMGQIVLNLSIILGLFHLMLNKDDFLTEAGPGAGLVTGLLLLIYTLITALQMRHRYEKTKLQRLSTINVWLMAMAFLSWAIAVVTFLP